MGIYYKKKKQRFWVFFKDSPCPKSGKRDPNNITYMERTIKDGFILCHHISVFGTNPQLRGNSGYLLDNERKGILPNSLDKVDANVERILVGDSQTSNISPGALVKVNFGKEILCVVISIIKYTIDNRQVNLAVVLRTHDFKDSNKKEKLISAIKNSKKEIEALITIEKSDLEPCNLQDEDEKKLPSILLVHLVRTIDIKKRVVKTIEHLKPEKFEEILEKFKILLWR